jgi:hypothetical protein
MSDTFKPFVADLPALDIVNSLRTAPWTGGGDETWLLMAAAADEIETLRDEGERLRVTVENLRIRLAQARAKVNVPADWKLAPVEPTEEMMRAAVVYVNGTSVYQNVTAAALEIEESIYGEVYAAMLAAAPEKAGGAL